MKDVELAEYNALRNESIQLYDFQQKTMLQCLVFVGALIAFYITMLNQYGKELWVAAIPVFVIPIAIYVIVFTVLGIHLRNTKINVYLFYLTRQMGLSLTDPILKKNYYGWAHWYAEHGNNNTDRVDLGTIVLALVFLSFSCVAWGLHLTELSAGGWTAVVLVHLALLLLARHYALKILKEIKALNGGLGEDMCTQPDKKQS